MLKLNRRTLSFIATAAFAATSMLLAPLTAMAQSNSTDKHFTFPSADAPVQASVSVDRANLDFHFNLQADFAVVRVSGPNLFSLSKRVEDASYINVDLLRDLNLSGYVDNEVDKQALADFEYLPDGHYKFEVVVYGTDGVRHTTKGQFKVFGGNAILLPERPPSSSLDGEISHVSDPGIFRRVASAVVGILIPSAHAQGITPDDFVTIIDGAGDDHTRLNFSQTTAESTRFSIQNFEGDFKILEGIGTPALSNTPFLNIVGSTGKVGFGTDTPQETIHLVAGGNNFAGFRIEDTRGHWTLSTGGLFEDLGFRIRDSANGTTPFRIETTAPTDSIRVAANGDIGIGTSTPTASVNVSRLDTAQLVVENTTGVSAERGLLRLANAGKVRFVLQNTGNGSWSFDNSGSSFDISRIGTGVAEMRVFSNGNATFQGNVTANGVVLSSSRALKTDFKDVEATDILDKVSALDIMEWRYKKEDEGTAHIGPMAEDFRQIFGLGDGKTLNMVDTTGIAFAAIQGLREEQRSEVARLREENAELRERVAEIDTIKAQLEGLTVER